MTVDPSLFRCKWEQYPPPTIDMWNDFVLLVKRGNSPLISCPIYFMDVAECELKADSKIAKQKQEKQAGLDLLKSNGIL